MQAVVEGIGVPVAIGATGVLLLALDAFDLGVGAVIVFGLVLGVIWTAIAVGVYRSYTRSLADELRRRSSLAGDVAISAEEDVAAVQALLRSDDARDVRIGLDLLAGVVLAGIGGRASPARGARGSGGSCPSAGAARSDRARRRPRGAGCAPRRSRPVGTGRGARCGRAGRRRAIRRSCAASSQPSSRWTHRGQGDRCALAARRRRGPDPRRRSSNATPRRPPARRSCARPRPQRLEHGVAVVAPALDHPDRAVVLTALDALDAARRPGRRPLGRPGRASSTTPRALAAHALAARARRFAEDETPLARALDDEIELARRLVIAVLALRYGDRVREAVRAIEHGEGARRALGVEALDVVLTREEAAVALPLVRHDLTIGGSGGRAAPRCTPGAIRRRSGSRISPAIRRASGARRGFRRAHGAESRHSAWPDQPACEYDVQRSPARRHCRDGRLCLARRPPRRIVLTSCASPSERGCRTPSSGRRRSSRRRA